MHSYRILPAASSVVWNKRKQIDSHKACSKCPPLARTQTRKRVGHWITASSNQRLIQALPHMQQTLSQLINVTKVTVT